MAYLGLCLRWGGIKLGKELIPCELSIPKGGGGGGLEGLPPKYGPDIGVCLAS